MRVLREEYLNMQQLPQPVEEAAVQVRDLQKQLTALRISFGRLKTTVAQAFAPIASVLVPVLTKATWSAVRLVRTFGQVAAALLGVQVAQNKVEKSVVSVGKAVQRTVAGFDQLNRLNGRDGSGYRVETTVVPVLPKELPEEVQRIVDRILNLLEPIRQFDLTPLKWSFARLTDQVEVFAQTAGTVLEQLWFQVLIPLLQWLTERFSPAVTTLSASVVKFLQVSLEGASQGFLQMVQALQPLISLLGAAAVQAVQSLSQVFTSAAQTVSREGSAIGAVFRSVGNLGETVWKTMSSSLRQLSEDFGRTFLGVGSTIASVMRGYLLSVSSMIDAVRGLLTGDWNLIWNSMGAVVKNTVNGIIGMMNTLLRGMTAGLNGILSLLNHFSVDIPQWVPIFGGEVFGFDLDYIKTPQIPYLAKGAVLPANKPFLAMVGDQRHGTNVEAPLSVIQQAVAETMEGFVGSNLAGHQATVEVLRQILEAVLGIRIGEGELSRAVDSYRQKRSMIHGI